MMLIFSRRSIVLLTLLLLLAAWATAQPQISVIPPPPGGSIHQISTTGLDEDDLVFYRFSDGYDATVIATSTFPNATLRRTFQSSTVKVSAYVAKKNGPFNFTSATLTGLTVCATCTQPGNLPGSTKLNIRPASWEAFEDANMTMYISDNTTTPTFIMPSAMPWFILPVSLKPSVAGYAEVNLPVSGGILVGAFVKGKWIAMPSTSSTPYSTGGDVHVSSFTYSPNKVKVNFGPTLNQEFNVYLVIRTTTLQGQGLSFNSGLYNTVGTLLQSGNTVNMVTKLNPHDPNRFTPYVKSICFTNYTADELRYRIDFQNLGQGDAENVLIKARFPSSLLNVLSLNTNTITSSHNLSEYIIDPDGNSIGFKFIGINLPGLDRDPQPEISLTKGWVEFSLTSNTCFSSLNYWASEGYVTFVGNNGSFSETIQTNNAKQNNGIDCQEPECFGGSESQSETSNSTEEFTSANTFQLKCYPSPVATALNLSLSGLSNKAPIHIQVYDSKGRLILEQQRDDSNETQLELSVDTGAWSSGIYLIRVVQGNQMAIERVLKL